MEFLYADIELGPRERSAMAADKAMHRTMLFDKHPRFWRVEYPDGTCSVSRQLANQRSAEPPIAESGDTVVAFSGYLTNQTELARRHELQRADAASLPLVALHSWNKWGEQAPTHFYGCFALIVWDRRRREVFLAVDHCAQRTLYYFYDSKRVVVASLPQAVASSPSVDSTVNDLQLARFVLPCFLRNEESFFRGVHQIAPGTGVVVNASAKRSVRYWRPEAVHVTDASLDSLQKCRQLVEDGVRGATSVRSAGKMGVFLSGGLDSSVVATTGAKVCQELGEPRIELISTTSKSAVNNGEQDDWYYATLLNKHLGSSIYPIVGLECSNEGLDRFFAGTGMPPESMDYPVEAAMLDTLHAAGASLVLCGEGGEASASSYARGLLPELFTRCSFGQLAREWYGEWIRGRRASSLLWETLYPLVSDRLLSLSGIRRCDQTFLELANKHFLNPEFLRPLWKAGLSEEVETALSYPRFWFPRDRHSVRANDLDSIRLVPVSRTSIGFGFGLEVACPLLDRRLIEWVLSMPPTIRRRNGQSRRLIRDAYRAEVPIENLERTSKSPRFPDYPDWLLRHRCELEQPVVDSVILSSGLFSHVTPCHEVDLPRLHRLHVTRVAMRFLSWSKQFWS